MANCLVKAKMLESFFKQHDESLGKAVQNIS